MIVSAVDCSVDYEQSYDYYNHLWEQCRYQSRYQSKSHKQPQHTIDNYYNPKYEEYLI